MRIPPNVRTAAAVNSASRMLQWRAACAYRQIIEQGWLDLLAGDASMEGGDDVVQPDLFAASMEGGMRMPPNGSLRLWRLSREYAL